MDSSSHPGAEVGRTCEDVAQVLVVHVLLPALRLDGFLHETETLAPPLEHLHHVASLLHGDYAHVVLLVYPYKEVLLPVVPDAARVRPIPGHAGSQQERGDRFVEQEMVVDQLFLLLVRHVLERVVLACEIAGQSRQSVLQNLLHGPALSAVACRWEPVPTDTPTGADAAAQDVLRVELSVAFDVGGVQVCLVLRVLAVASVSLLDDVIEKGCECLVCVLVPCDHTHRHDEGVARVVHSGLDGLVECESGVRLHPLQLPVEVRGQAAGHPVVVLLQVWVVGRQCCALVSHSQAKCLVQSVTQSYT